MVEMVPDVLCNCPSLVSARPPVAGGHGGTATVKGPGVFPGWWQEARAAVQAQEQAALAHTGRCMDRHCSTDSQDPAEHCLVRSRSELHRARLASSQTAAADSS